MAWSSSGPLAGFYFGDQAELLAWQKLTSAKRTFPVHGEEDIIFAAEFGIATRGFVRAHRAITASAMQTWREVVAAA